MSLAQALPPIPEKHAFKIGEVSTLVGVKPHVLRYWEREFARVRPQKSKNGHRLYSQADVELLRRIRLLVHERRYTIDGARAVVRAGDAAIESALAARPGEVAVALDEAAADLESLKRDLDEARACVVQAEKACARAEEEAMFWRKATQAAELRLEALRVEVRAELVDFKKRLELK